MRRCISERTNRGMTRPIVSTECGGDSSQARSGQLKPVQLRSRQVRSRHAMCSGQLTTTHGTIIATRPNETHERSHKKSEMKSRFAKQMCGCRWHCARGVLHVEILDCANGWLRCRPSRPRDPERSEPQQHWAEAPPAAALGSTAGSDEARSAQVRSEQNGSGQGRSGQVRSGQVRSGQVRSARKMDVHQLSMKSHIMRNACLSPSRSTSSLKPITAAAMDCETSRARAWQIKSVQVT